MFYAVIDVAPRSAPKADLLSDDEDEPETAFRAPTAAASSLAIANAKNQLESTQRSLSNAKPDRAQIEAAAAESVAADLSARAAANIRTTREVLIRAESDLSALRAEKADIEGAVLRDKEDIRATIHLVTLLVKVPLPLQLRPVPPSHPSHFLL